MKRVQTAGDLRVLEYRRSDMFYMKFCLCTTAQPKKHAPLSFCILTSLQDQKHIEEASKLPTQAAQVGGCMADNL